jgi:hypothetical protein
MWHHFESPGRKFSVVLSFSSCILSLLILVNCGGSGGTSPSTPSSPPPPSIKIAPISPGNVTLNPGAIQQFKTSVTGTTNTAVDWEVNGNIGGNAQFGTISAAGLYTAPTSLSKAGTFTITAMSVAENSVTATASATVNPSPVVSVVIAPTSAAIAISTTQQFTATVSGSSNMSVTWSVDGVTGGNVTVGTISNSGLYTGPSLAGVHTVTATSVADTAKNASASVSVLSLSVSPSTIPVAPNGTQQFTANIQGASNTSVTWSVDGVTGGNATIGTISNSGLYTAPGTLGTHTITVTSVEIPTLSANATVTVQNSSPGVVSVLSYHNDDVRDGVNSNETTLTLSNVNSQLFGKKYTFPVDGQIYGQPLYVPNLTINGTSHNTVFAATENDTVYAFDADGASNSSLWQNHLGTPPANNDDEGIAPVLGITSTPVIDLTTNTLYVVTDTEVSGNRVYSLHALDATSGSEEFGGPVVVTGTVPGTGQDSVNGELTLETGCSQRTGLALDPVSSAIYISIGHCTHGWVLAYNKTSLQQIAIMATTPNGAGGGLWANAPAVDDTSGDIFLLTGVDENDPMSGYNDSAVRLSATDLSVLDYFMPSNENFLSLNDLDVGSGGGIIMPNNLSSTPHEYIGGGKDGRIFVINRDNMGQFQTTNQVIQTVQTGVNEHDNIYSTPAFWNGFLYYHCQDDVLRAFSWDVNTGLLSTSPVGLGDVTYGIHGATSSISANGTTNGIVWEIETTNAGTGPAILHAYNAMLVDQELYNSTQAGSRDTAGIAVKFTVPTVADGHVFVGTAAEFDIYGLLSQP